MMAPNAAPVTLALIANIPAVVAWRVGWPMVELSRRGYPVAWADVDGDEARTLLGLAEVVVLPRLSWAPGDEAKALAFRDLLHRHGTALVYDIDDDVISPAIIERIAASDFPLAGDDDVEAARCANVFALRLADGVTCSTERLAALARGLSDKPVIVVPNAIDIPRFRAGMFQYPVSVSLESDRRGAADRVRDSQHITIGWVGINRPDRDALALAEAWGRIATRYPEVRFLVGGHDLGALVRAVPAGRLTVAPRLPLSRYPSLYAQVDIGCCTLADVPFNHAKSPIKAFEYAVAGAAVVASPTVYGRLIDDGHSGLLADTADGWEAALRLLIEQPVTRRTLAANLLSVVERDHSLETNVTRWPDAWAAILADFRARHDMAAPLQRQNADAARTRDAIAV